MYGHANAKLGLAGRVSLVRLVESGVSIREAARRQWRLAGDWLYLVARPQEHDLSLNGPTGTFDSLTPDRGGPTVGCRVLCQHCT